MQKMTGHKLRPFHETIVEAIRRASSAELECLATLIKGTEVSKGCDEIIVAWNERRKEMCWGDEDLGVPAILLEQKNFEREKKSINLDDLQQEVEKLLSLLTVREFGLMTWHEFVRERLDNLHKITSQALGK